jgi:hypothetical protein
MQITLLDALDTLLVSTHAGGSQELSLLVALPAQLVSCNASVRHGYLAPNQPYIYMAKHMPSLFNSMTSL